MSCTLTAVRAGGVGVPSSGGVRPSAGSAYLHRITVNNDATDEPPGASCRVKATGVDGSPAKQQLFLWDDIVCRVAVGRRRTYRVHLVTGHSPTVADASSDSGVGDLSVPAQRSRPSTADRPKTINDVLPKELILRIFSYLDLVSMCRCASVCKLWSVLAVDGSNWRSVDLFPYQKHVKGLTVERLAQRCGGFLRRLSLYGCENITDSAVQQLSLHCAHVESLNVSKCRRLSDASLRSLAARCSRLRSLTLQGCGSLTGAGLTAVGAGCPALRHIDVSWCYRVDDAGLKALAQGCRLLQKFVANGCTNITDEGIAHVSANCPQLTTVSLHSCHQLTDASVRSLACGCRELRSFSAALMHQITDRSIVALTDNCAKLRDLELIGCHRLTDLSLINIGRNCKDLRRIDCEDLVLLTDEGVKHLASNCSQLIQVTLSHCESLTDESVRHVAGAQLSRPRPTLAVLELDNCPAITDAALEPLAHLASLRRLDLYDCAMVSKAAIHRLTRRRPGLSVHAYFAPTTAGARAADGDEHDAQQQAEAERRVDNDGRRRCPNACVIL